ncbi:MAG TPA: VCBS repeat-containing protein [Mucilaginibacter sp.]|jgi:hypothetical protein|nr:VCBS repeat-containing protein [Mucilaginibacter sp.]
MKKLFVLMVAATAGMLVILHGAERPALYRKVTTIKVGKSPNSVEVADLNGDKIPDIIVANGGDSSVTILLGTGKGSFKEATGSPFYAGAQPNDIAIADLNKDGIPDLVFANHTKKYLTVLIGDGKGGFRQMKGSPLHVTVVPHTHGVAVADFNHDGNPDLATDSWGNNHIRVLFGNKHAGFDTPGMFIPVGKHPYQRLRVADLNRDGNPDIVTTNLDGNNCTVLLGDGKGGFTQPPGSPFSCGDSPFGVAIGDINGDGLADLAIVNSPSITASNTGQDGLTVLTGNGNGGFAIMHGSPFATGRSPSRVAIGDINGDGFNDIAVTNYHSNFISIFLMDKNGVTSSYTIPAGQRSDGLAIADAYGDGRKELLATNSNDGTLNIIKP